MIDEKRLIKKLDNRIDAFVKEHPEEKDCLAVQSVREFKQMIEAEAKEEVELEDMININVQVLKCKATKCVKNTH